MKQFLVVLRNGVSFTVSAHDFKIDRGKPSTFINEQGEPVTSTYIAMSEVIAVVEAPSDAPDSPIDKN